MKFAEWGSAIAADMPRPLIRPKRRPSADLAAYPEGLAPGSVAAAPALLCKGVQRWRTGHIRRGRAPFTENEKEVASSELLSLELEKKPHGLIPRRAGGSQPKLQKLRTRDKAILV